MNEQDKLLRQIRHEGSQVCKDLRSDLLKQKLEELRDKIDTYLKTT